MKNKKIKLLTILSAGALVMGLASCGETNSSDAGSSEATSSSDQSSAKTATRISSEEIGYVVEGTEVNLDDYITIIYDDSSKDHNYEVTCTSDDVSISGHTVTPLSHGSYTLTITAGSVKARKTLTAVSEDHKELIDFLAPLSETPNNYTLKICDWDDSGSLAYGGETVIHNPNYIAIFDEEDPTSVDKEGNPNSTLLAKLSDGHAYWGTLQGTNDNVVPTFEPGYASWSNYYITGDLSLDATDATYEESASGEYLMLGETFEANILNYGISNFPENYGYSYAGAIYEGVADTDGDGVNDMAVFDLLVSNGTQIGLWTAIALCGIGTSSLDVMEEAITDAKYLPTKVEAPEIGTVFGKLAETNNFTLTTEIYSATSKGEAYTPAEGDTWTTDTMTLWTGTPSIRFTTTYTSNGVISIAETKKLSQDDDGNYVVADDYSFSGEFAIFDDGTDTYISQYDSTTSSMAAPTKKVEGKTAYESGLTDNMKASGITEEVANGTIWSSKKTSGTATTFDGNVGDSNGTDEIYNELFGKLLDMNGFSWFSDDSCFGTAWTEAADWGTATHALTLGLSYDYFTVDTATNEVSVFVTGYLPINFGVTQNNQYVAVKVTISEVGTTTNDFTFGASSTGDAE